MIKITKAEKEMVIVGLHLLRTDIKAGKLHPDVVEELGDDLTDRRADTLAAKFRMADTVFLR